MNTSPYELVRQHFCLHKKFLVFNLVSKNLKVKYRRSLLGVFWTLLNPILSALMYYVVFQVILKIQRENYLLLMVSGVLAFNFFAQSVSEGVTHYVDNQNLITKIALPLQAFNLSTVVTNMVTLLAGVPVVIALGLATGVTPSLNLLALPALLLSLFLITYSFSIMAAVTFVFLRDLKQVVALVLQLLFYGTPIIYSTAMVPEQFRWLLKANPLATVIPAIQATFVGSPIDMSTISISLTWAVLLTIVALFVVRSKRRSVVENL